MSKRRIPPPSIPTDEEFARASALMAARDRKCAKIKKFVFQSLNNRAPLHDVYVFPGPNTGYQVYVFYKHESDIATCRDDGNEQLIKDAILEQCAAISNDLDHAPTVAFTFDSHEQVKKQFNGDYYKYFR